MFGGRQQRGLADMDAEIGRRRVADDETLVMIDSENTPNEVSEPVGLRTGEFQSSIGSRAQGKLRERFGNVVGRNRLR
jgi:hypothetical protein